MGWEPGFTTILMSSFHPRTHVTLGQHVSLGSSQLGQSLSDFPCFGDAAVVRTTGPVFCRIPHNLDLSEAFLMLGSSYLLCCLVWVELDQCHAAPACSFSLNMGLPPSGAVNRRHNLEGQGILVSGMA